jgi:hypothetical protein
MFKRLIDVNVIFLTVFQFLILTLNTNAVQNTWPGIVNDTVIISDTTIVEHDPLIIPAGTHIIFRKNATLYAKVPVKAIGTCDKPIYLGPSGSATSPEWNSFSIEAQASDSTIFKYCLFGYADKPIIINQIGNVLIKECYFFKLNSVGITCNKLSDNLIVENCYFQSIWKNDSAIVQLFDGDSGSKAFLNKNVFFTEYRDTDVITSDTIENIYYTNNCFWNNWGSVFSMPEFYNETGIGPSWAWFKVMVRLKYSNGNKLKANLKSQNVSIDGKVISEQKAPCLLISNKTKKIFANKVFICK